MIRNNKNYNIYKYSRNRVFFFGEKEKLGRDLRIACE